MNSSLERVREDVFDGVNNNGEDDINREQISELDVYSRFGFSYADAALVSLLYSGTPLLWTPWGPTCSKVSCIEKCPHFRGKFVFKRAIFGT